MFLWVELEAVYRTARVLYCLNAMDRLSEGHKWLRYALGDPAVVFIYSECSNTLKYLLLANNLYCDVKH